MVCGMHRAGTLATGKIVSSNFVPQTEYVFVMSNHLLDSMSANRYIGAYIKKLIVVSRWKMEAAIIETLYEQYFICSVHQVAGRFSRLYPLV